MGMDQSYAFPDSLPRMGVKDRSRGSMGRPSAKRDAKGGTLGVSSRVNKKQEKVLTRNTFGLNEAEIANIKEDIEANIPIGIGQSDNAYQKFLGILFPNQNITFPYYYANPFDAGMIAVKLTELLGSSVRLVNEDEGVKSIIANMHFMGHENPQGGIDNRYTHGFIWTHGESKDGKSPALFINQLFHSFTQGKNGIQYGFMSPNYKFSVILAFG